MNLLFKPANCFPDNCFCEVLRSGSIIQPVNTFSNIFFIIAGFYIIYLSYRQNQQHSKDYLGYLLGLITIIIGIGSSYYHSELNFLGQIFDLGSMFLLIILLFVYSLRDNINNKSLLIVGYLASNMILFSILIFYPESRRMIFAWLVVGYLLLELYIKHKRDHKRNNTLLFSSFILLLTGYILWNIDNYRVFCYPYSIFQLHAFWHFLTALSIIYIFKYYKSN